MIARHVVQMHPQHQGYAYRRKKGKKKKSEGGENIYSKKVDIVPSTRMTLEIMEERCRDPHRCLLTLLQRDGHTVFLGCMLSVLPRQTFGRSSSYLWFLFL